MKCVDIQPIIKAVENEGKDIVTVELLRQLPSVEFEIVKHGKWVDKEIYPGLLHAACSECGTLCNEYRCEQVLTKYCPECGAKLL